MRCVYTQVYTCIRALAFCAQMSHEMRQKARAVAAPRTLAPAFFANRDPTSPAPLSRAITSVCRALPVPSTGLHRGDSGLGSGRKIILEAQVPAISFGRATVHAITAAAAMTLASAGSLFASGFTAEQAEAGKTAYMSHCAQCHGAQLEGPEAPGLFGQDVMGNWDTAGGLYDFISVAMPPAAPGQLGEDVYLQIVAHIMAENGATAGDAALELAAAADLSLVEATKEGAAAQEAERLAAGGGEAVEVIAVPQAYTWGKELPQYNK